ncbi:GspH/FimT family protein [Acinetobacter junii]|uniref:GspH/FimT family protein n=1 Tax=Acinetobacter junii TaxID=40215 RepID=UPI001FB3906D|nr:GspH/FimT family pseudopilin [Acinetobacter junii]UOB52676.1 GspH/FimT family protein [Acinetobacter junii]
MTIAIFAIIAAIAAPSMSQLLVKQNLNKSTQELIAVLNQGRAKAAIERKEITINLNTTNIADKDVAQKDTTSTEFTTLNWMPSGKAVLKTGSVTTLKFLPTGLVKDATTDTSIIICDQTSGSLSKTVSISKMGTIQQVVEGTCS